MTSTALILAAHGSHHEPVVNAAIRAHAQALSTEGLFDEVLVAFHQGSPKFCEVLDHTSAKRIVVVPVMTSEGYYCDEVLPREIGATKPRSHEATKVVITCPVGTHPRLAEAVAERVRTWRGKHRVTYKDLSVVVIGHGTRRNARSRTATEELVAALRNFGVCHETLVAFLDDDPLIDGIGEKVTRPHVLVLPFLIGGGPHAREDIPRRVKVPSQTLVYVDEPIGAMFEVRCLIRELAMDALEAFEMRVSSRETAQGADGSCSDKSSVPTGLDASGARLPRLERRGYIQAVPTGLKNDGASQAHAVASLIDNRQSTIDNRPVSTFGLFDVSTFRLGTRGSALALWQARHVQGLLRERGIRVDLVEISTSGDRRLDCAISELNGDAPFTDDIDEALRRGDIDLAVHALKDLPVPLPEDLELVAVLPRGPVTESLVSRNGSRLGQLQPGARIGTSSPRRAAQILRLRPDVRPVTIRGAVDDRVRQVRRGDFDAAILATAGLERLGLMHEIAETFSLDQVLPAPGQGALVIQIRRGDDRLRALLAPFDHRPTRLAVSAELELFRRLQDFPECAVAARAQVDNAGMIKLHARLVALAGDFATDARVYGADHLTTARHAAESVLARSTIDIRQSTILS